jgi:hypothetical protein
MELIVDESIQRNKITFVVVCVYILCVYIFYVYQYSLVLYHVTVICIRMNSMCIDRCRELKND